MDSKEVQERAKVTYRRLDFWVRKGYLKPTGSSGSGEHREWTRDECAKAMIIAQLMRAGMGLPKSAAVANAIVNSDKIDLLRSKRNPPGRIIRMKLAEDVHLSVDLAEVVGKLYDHQVPA